MLPPPTRRRSNRGKQTKPVSCSRHFGVGLAAAAQPWVTHTQAAGRPCGRSVRHGGSLVTDAAAATAGASVPVRACLQTSPHFKAAGSSVPKSPRRRRRQRPTTTRQTSRHFEIAAPPPRLRPVAPAGWAPPRSPFHLVEEWLWHRPWQLLVGCILLNKTAARQVLEHNVLSRLLARFPDATAMAAANDFAELEDLLRPLGLFFAPNACALYM